MQNIKRSLAIIFIDIIGMTLAHCFLFFVLNIPPSIAFIVASYGVMILSNVVSGSYQQLWRYTSFREVQNLFLSNIISFSCLLLLHSIDVSPISSFVLFNFFSVYFLYSLIIRGSRRLYVTTKKQSVENHSSLRILVIGAGNASSSLIKHILTDKKSIHIAGILDNDPEKMGARIHGIKVIGTLDDLDIAVKDHAVNQVIISMPSAPLSVTKALTHRLIKLNVPFKVVPHIRDMIDSSMPIHLNHLTLDDLIDDREFHDVKSAPAPKTRRVLITGGSGYIGTHLTEMLLASGYHVVLLDNHLYGDQGIQHLKHHDHLEIVYGDIANINDVVKSLKDVDTIIALAAIVGDPACGVNPQDTLNLNYESSKILVETANFYGIRRLVFASSCSVYGMSGNDLLTETSPLNPVSLYAKTRIMSENILFERSDSVSPVVLRLSTVFGYSSRMRFDLVVNLLTVKALVEKKFQIFGGNQWRPFIHCRDVARAFYLAATQPDDVVNRQIFNVGSDQLNYQLKDIGQLITTHLPDATYDILNENVDERNYRVSFDKIHSELNFSPEHDLNSGIIEMIEKIQSSSDLQDYKNTIFSNLETLKAMSTSEKPS